eukprot:2837102-Alexandrium_andersonii.AAC.1
MATTDHLEDVVQGVRTPPRGGVNEMAVPRARLHSARPATGLAWPGRCPARGSGAQSHIPYHRRSF